MRQYWEVKKVNYDKVVFFKLGKFYEIFHDDAILCHRVLDLNWMGDPSKLHVGFIEKALEKYLGLLIAMGFRVAVVE